MTLGQETVTIEVIGDMIHSFNVGDTFSISLQRVGIDRGTKQRFKIVDKKLDKIIVVKDES